MFTGYKIAKLDDLFNNQFTFGITDLALSETLIGKLNCGIKKFGFPYNECVPMFSDAFFVFQNENCLRVWMFEYCKLDENDLQELINNNYVVVKFTSVTSCSGLSKNITTYFPDEVVKYDVINLLEELNKPIEQISFVKVSAKDKEYTKQMYYKFLNRQ